MTRFGAAGAVLCAALVLAGTARAGTPPARPPAGPPRTTRVTARPLARPLVLSPQRIVGRSDGPRVLFVHAEPAIALELAPARPSYLRDDFTAALASPLVFRVRAYEPLADSLKGGTP